MEYWSKELVEQNINVKELMLKDTGRGVITKDPVEPLYGNLYMYRYYYVMLYE